MNSNSIYPVLYKSDQMVNKHRNKLEKIMEPVEKMIVDLSALRQKVKVTGEDIG